MYNEIKSWITTFGVLPFSIDAERKAWTTAASAGFLIALEGGPAVAPEDWVEWTVVPPLVVTDTVVEEVLITDDDTVIDTVDVLEVLTSLVLDDITFEVVFPWPSSFSLVTIAAEFCAFDSSFDVWVADSPWGCGMLLDVTIAATWVVLLIVAALAIVVTGVEVGGVDVSVEPPPFESRSFCATGSR